MESTFEETRARHARRRRDGIGVVTILIDAPAQLLDRVRMRAGAPQEERSCGDAWRAWRVAARARARDHALEMVARASGRAIEEVRAVVAQEGPERSALIERAASSHLPPVDRGILEALAVDDAESGEDVHVASALASLGCELPELLLEHPSAARLAWALRVVDACAALPITVALRSPDREALERELPRSLADRMRAGIVVMDAARAEPRFGDSAGLYAGAIAGAESAWREALHATRAADPDRARSLAERLLFTALEALPETRGLFRLNTTLAGVRFGPRDVEIDLFALSIGLAVEVDGFFHFLDADRYRRDRRKDALLQRSGLLVVRALASDVVERLADVLDAVLENVRHARSHKDHGR